MLLNLGSGPVATQGWVSVDRSPNIILERIPAARMVLFRLGLLQEAHLRPWDPSIVRQDIRKLRFPDASVDAVYSSHTLEHLYLAEAELVVAQAYRVLKPGGILRLALPDIEAFARDLVNGVVKNDQDAGRLFNDRLLAHPAKRPNTRERIRARVAGHVHRWQPSTALVRRMMEVAGFVEVRDWAFHEGDLPDLAAVETRRESFFLEGRKPAPAV